MSFGRATTIRPPSGTKSVMGRMPVSGVNRKDDSQLLDTTAAINIENYLVFGIAKLVKRGGQAINFTTGDTDVSKFCEEYRNDFDIDAYGTKVRAYNNIDKTFTDIKTNFSANNGGFSGGRYGDYFFVNNVVDGLWRISRTLNYQAKTVAFSVGKKITGSMSGATAVILQNVDAGVTGTLTAGSIDGAFIAGEIITGEGGGSATTNGILNFAITQVTNAPKARIFRVIGKRGILIGLVTDPSGYNYSDSDVGTNPPFNTWAIGTGYGDPGAGSYRNGGTALDASLIGDIIFIGQENGWYAFKISQTTLTDNLGATVSSKFDQEVAYRNDSPVYRCVMTDAGLIVVRNAGIFRLISLGQPNIPYSDQWEALTNDLGQDYFTDVTFTNADVMHDRLRGFIYTTVGKASATNNLVLATKVNLKGMTSSVKAGATSFIKGWNIQRFLVKGNDIFGMSATSGHRYSLFVGQKDINNAKIHTEYLQELVFGWIEAYKLLEFYCKGELSPISEIKISFDIIDETGYFIPRIRINDSGDHYDWFARNHYDVDTSGWGEAGFGNNGWGGGATSSGLIPDFTGAKPFLRQVLRTFLRFESDDFGDHTINWFNAEAKVTKRTRQRHLTLSS